MFSHKTFLSMYKLVLYIFYNVDSKMTSTLYFLKGDDNNSVLMECNIYIQQEPQVDPVIIKHR